MKATLPLLLILYLSFSVQAQHTHTQHANASALEIITEVEPQPLLAQAIRLKEALSFLGSSLSDEDARHLEALQDKPLTAEVTEHIQHILDPYCLAMVDINPEARVKVLPGPARARLVQNGWTSFLVKVHNGAGVNPKLEVSSPNAEPLLHVSSSAPRVQEKNVLSEGEVQNRFLEAQIYRSRPLHANLSGLNLEYAVLQVFSKEAGKREAEIGFNIGQGTQDIGFRNAIHILFDVQPAVQVTFNIKDEDGSPTMASFIIRDGIDRNIGNEVMDSLDNKYLTSSDQSLLGDYHYTKAVKNYGFLSKELKGLYPLPSRRVAAFDEYPDFFFQPQVYRSNGEHVSLPPGNYDVTYTRGPEYQVQQKTFEVPANKDAVAVSFQLKRWVNMAEKGWYSGDHHVHAAGCSHYESPEEGVQPIDMWRQIVGEDLNVAAVLTWGPSWYYQKSFFTGKTDPLSTSNNIMRYDVEVSGFPSSHAGHVVLLQLEEDDYPNTSTIEEWPSWTLPVLNWAKGQGGATGYAHSGWGLEPEQAATELPNYVMPKMDGIGANEYVVTVTQNAVDFYSAGDTPAPWELNMWYHTLNSGFRTRLSGETDFPCIYDERVGLARSYFKTDDELSFPAYVDAIKKGRSYVSEGGSHIIDFAVNGLEMGTGNSELALPEPQTLKVTAKVAAYLPERPDETEVAIAGRNLAAQPYWHIERARMGNSRNVMVELIVNGLPVDTAEITADGDWENISFDYAITQSSWVALRVFPSSHTNPVFVVVNNQPIRVKQSALWCRQAVDQCWKMKQPAIRSNERAAAQAAYDQARKVYDKMIEQATDR